MFLKQLLTWELRHTYKKTWEPDSFSCKCASLSVPQCIDSNKKVTQFYIINAIFAVFFFKCIYWLCYYSCPISPPSLNSILPTPSLPHSPLQVMSMGHTFKFFGFYISYTILTLPLSIFHLSFMLFILCTFLPSLPLPLPYW